MKKRPWGNYATEFIFIFVAVILAFALDNWNDNRRERAAEAKILTEIANGLLKDLDDIAINVSGHRDGLRACAFWRKLINGQETALDSLPQHYLSLTRDFFTAQNRTGYETLKSRGLELIRNDSLRLAVISLYEYDYDALHTLEEDYYETQFQRNYFRDFNRFIADDLVFDDKGNITSIDRPLSLTSAEKQTLLSYLWKIEVNRKFVLYYYSEVEKNVQALIERIEKVLAE